MARRTHRAAIGGVLLCLGSAACGSTANEDDAGSGEPSLTALSVNGTVDQPDAGPKSTSLSPAYDPAIHDYVVSCNEGANKLSISMTAAPGSNSALVRPGPTSPSSPMQTVSVTIQGNGVVVASASNAKGSVQYWVRCMPTNVPQIKVTRHPENGTATPGYYLLGNLLPIPGASGPASTAMVVDQNGIPLWYAVQPHNLPILDVDSVIGKTISFSERLPTGSTPDPNQPFTVVDLSSSEESVSTLTPKTVDTVDFHELQYVALRDTYVVFAYPKKTGVDLSGLVTAPIAGSKHLGPNSNIIDCQVTEFDRSGSVKGTPWLMSEHFDPKAATTYIDVELDGYYDVFHCNSLDVDPANGNYLISARQLDSVFYVDSATRKVLWKMGGRNSSIDKATFVAVPDAFHRQHDGRLVKGWEPDCYGGSGQVSLFDDADGTSEMARGVVYDVVVGGGSTKGCSGSPSGKAGMAAVNAEYKGSGTVPIGGSVRTYEDGSRVVGWGVEGMPQTNPILTEYDPSGKPLLDLNFVPFAFSYRAIKVPLTAFDVANLRSNAGKPLP